MAEISTVSMAWAVFSAIGGSIVGGAISATVAFWTQKRNLDAAKTQRESDRLEKRRATAYSLFFKMIRIHSTIDIIHATLSSLLTEGKKKGFAALWQMVLPLGNLPDRVKFTAEEKRDEMAPLMRIAAHVRTILAPHVPFNFMDWCRLWPTHDVKRNGLMGAAAEAADLKVEATGMRDHCMDVGLPTASGASLLSC